MKRPYENPEMRLFLAEETALRESVRHLAAEVLSQPTLFNQQEQIIAEQILKALRGGHHQILEQIMNTYQPAYWRVIADYLIVRQMVTDVLRKSNEENKIEKRRKKRRPKKPALPQVIVDGKPRNLFLALPPEFEI